MNIVSSISSFLNKAQQPVQGTLKRVWSLDSFTPTDCIEVVIDCDGDVLANHLVIDPRTRATQSRDYITDGYLDAEAIKELSADIENYLQHQQL